MQFLRKSGKTDFVGVALCRDRLLVAPLANSEYRPLGTMGYVKMALEWGRYLLPVQSYMGYTKFENVLKCTKMRFL